MAQFTGDPPPYMIWNDYFGWQLPAQLREQREPFRYGTGQAWECPRCHTINGPHTAMCFRCAPSVKPQET